MNEQLISALEQLKGDPSIAVQLYEHLFNGCFWTMAWRRDTEAGSGDTESGCFVGCERADGSWEIPVFTQPDRELLRQLMTDIPAAERVSLSGTTMWRQILKDYLIDESKRVAVDPGEEHAIWLTRVMVLGMIEKCGNATGGRDRSE